MPSSLCPAVSLAAATFLLLLAATVFSNLSLHPSLTFDSWNHRSGSTLDQLRPKNPFPKLLLSLEEGPREVYHRDPDPLLPPINATAEGSIAWFRENLPELRLLLADGPARKFRSRAREFFSGACEVRIFMTWISSARAFGRRELLALESVFRAHPYGCLMILSAAMDSRRGTQILEPLTDSGYRVAALSPDFSFLLKGTPAEKWFGELRRGNVDPGEIPLPQNLSNLLRLAVLYKYGGVYLDTDIIILRNFSALRNAIGAQAARKDGSWSRLNNAVLIFDRNHPLVYRFIREFSLTFDGSKWGHNGPYLVSRVVARLEKGTHSENFTILPPSAFYPVDWLRINGLFRQPEGPAASKWAAAKLRRLREESFAVHLWNKRTGGWRIEGGSVIAKLISRLCIFCDESFVDASLLD